MTDNTPPPITPALRKAAAEQPGGWVYVIDPFFPQDGNVPPYGIEGAWKVDDEGKISGEFQRNAKYRPSPVKLGMPKPGDDTERQLQLAATGYGTEESLMNALRSSDVYIPGDGTVETVVYSDSRGDFVALYTRPEIVPENYRFVERVPFETLLQRLPDDASVVVNPGRPSSVRIPVAALMEGGTGR